MALEEWPALSSIFKNIKARQGAAWQGRAGPGKARARDSSGMGSVHAGGFSHQGHGRARQGMAWHGWARLGMARQGLETLATRVRLGRWVLSPGAGLGLARPGRARQGRQ